MAEEEGIKRGMVCIYSAVEPCRTFSFRHEKVRAFNPLSREDIQLFKAMMSGEHYIRGLSNADIQS